MDRRQFLAGTSLAALLPLAGTGGARAATHGRLLPVPLAAGDTIGLVSPSSATDDSFNLQLAREAMEALGFKVKAGPHLGSRHGHLAGTDAERAGDLNAMFADKTVKAIVADANAMLNEHPGIQHDFFVFQMDSYGDYALRLFLYAFTKGTDYNEYMRIKEDILLRIGEIVHKHGAELAVPTSTVHMPEGVNLRRVEAFAEGLVEQPQAT